MRKIFLAEETIDRKDIGSLIEWLQTFPRLTKDHLTLEFEKKWSQAMGRKHSVFCNSGSSANLLMFYALLLSRKLKNKKVIVPSAGWVTSLAPAIQFGFEPIMCEADRESFGLDLNHLEDLLKKHKPGAVMLVQVLGVPHKMDAIFALKQKYGFYLLEDACASVGSRRFEKKIGSFGDMAGFSFYFGHQMSTIEGGMVSTDDPDIFRLLLMLRSHGWSRDMQPSQHQALVQQYSIDDFGYPFVFYEPGFNLRSTDLNAFLGLRQLEKLDGTVERRHRNHLRYQKKLERHFTIQHCDDPQAILSTIHFCGVAKNTEERCRIVAALTENQIETRLFTAGNLGRHPFWFERYGLFSAPVADRLHACGFFLPNHQALKDEEVDFICDVVLKSAARPGEAGTAAKKPAANPGVKGT